MTDTGHACPHCGDWTDNLVEDGPCIRCARSVDGMQRRTLTYADEYREACRYVRGLDAEGYVRTAVANLLECEHCGDLLEFRDLGAHLRDQHPDVIEDGVRDCYTQARLERGDLELVYEDEFGRDYSRALWGSPPAEGWRYHVHNR